MGVRREDFMFVGVNMKDKIDINAEWDKYEDYLEDERIKNKDIYCILDGYGGEYLLFGEVLKHGNDNDGLDLNIINNDDIEEAKVRVAQKLKEELGFEEKVEFFVLTHWC